MTWITTAGGRKFVVTLFVSLQTFVLQYAGKLDADGSVYGWIIVAVAAGFVTSNVAQKVLGNKGSTSSGEGAQ